MTSTITGDSGAHSPHLILGYEADSSSGNIEHPIVGTPEKAYTLRPAGRRAGTLTALFDDLSDALDVEADLKAGTTLEFTDTDHAALNMTFVLADNGRVRLRLDPDTRQRWTVVFDFQEVEP